MKREIKFRVWNKEKKCWYEPIYEAYKGNLFDLHLGLSGDINERAFDEHGHERLTHESVFPDRYELMQYTGLKDKNGKEIYEGDILKDELCHFKEDMIREIAWDDYNCQYALRRKHITEHSDFEPRKDGYVYSIMPHKTDFEIGMEVIGNIYENPELLKSK
jgi:uncharacterized phage protein (TIGR01671 family)